MPAPTTRFCLIRHGETEWNTQKRYQGQIDIDLNTLGEAQARALQPVLRAHAFDAVVASDLARAWRTAHIATQGSHYAVLPGLTFRERHYGVFQGLTVEEARTVHPHAHVQYSQRSLDYNFETGESLQDFAQRVLDGFAALAAEQAGKTVAVFTHGGVLDIVYRVASGRDLRGPRDFPIPNAGVNWLNYVSGKEQPWQLESWAQCAHLAQLDLALDEVA